MILRAKIFLLWLLALAIPVQGLAAALQSACAPMQHEMPGMQASPALHKMVPQAHEHQHQHHESTPVTMSGDAAGHDMHHAMADAKSTHHPLHKTSSSCSSCATCNVGAVIPLALNALPAPDLPLREYLALPASGFVGYTPENPDRPPSFI